MLFLCIVYFLFIYIFVKYFTWSCNWSYFQIRSRTREALCAFYVVLTPFKFRTETYAWLLLGFTIGHIRMKWGTVGELCDNELRLWDVSVQVQKECEVNEIKTNATKKNFKKKLSSLFLVQTHGWSLHSKSLTN